MSSFFESIGYIRGELVVSFSIIDDIKNLQAEALDAITEQQQNEISQKLEG
jgi:hypothetical protein